MKNPIPLVLCLMLPFLSLSQQVGVAHHGSEYLEFRKMTKYDFKDQGYCLTLANRMEGNSLFDRNSTYAYSSFPQKMYAYDTELARQFVSEVEKMGKDFINTAERRLFNDFYNCKEKAYIYVQLTLRKYEAISAYYMDLYNLKWKKRQQQVQLEQRKEEAATALQQERDTYLQNLGKELQASIDEKEAEMNAEIKKLQIRNYQQEKQKIVEAYRPSLSKLKNHKKEEMASAEMYWADKISRRQKELGEAAAIGNANQQAPPTTETSATEHQFLQKTREEVELQYQQELQTVHQEISKLFSS